MHESAVYDSSNNSIILNEMYFETLSPREKMDFIGALSHELCHANQEKSGLYYTEISDASFSDTFRVAKMMETETRLLDATIEAALLSEPEFKNVSPTLETQYYLDRLAYHKQNNVSKAEASARVDFVKAYWQNGFKRDLPDGMRTEVNRRYEL